MTSVIDVGGIIAYAVHKIIFQTKQSSKNIQHESVNLRVLTMLIISSSVCMEYVHILQFFWESDKIDFYLEICDMRYKGLTSFSIAPQSFLSFHWIILKQKAYLVTTTTKMKMKKIYEKAVHHYKAW
jgi:hypothetical protein